jgi:ribonuclease HI
MIKVYTDGSCHIEKDPKTGYGTGSGKGGWSYLLQFSDGEEITNSGGSTWTTNNQMEMKAVIKALSSFDKPEKLMVHTDSMYVFKGITDWIQGWKKNGWRTANKKPVKNKELWVELDYLSSKHDIEWVWVKAHNGHRENEIVDKLANEAVPD